MNNLDDDTEQAARLLKGVLAAEVSPTTSSSAPAPVFQIGTAANVAQTIVIGRQVQLLDSSEVTKGSDDNAGKQPPGE